MIAAVMQARENRDLSGNSIIFFERSGARGGIPSYSSTTVLRKGRRFWIKALILCQQCTHFVLQLYSSAGTRALQLLRFDFSESPVLCRPSRKNRGCPEQENLRPDPYTTEEEILTTRSMSMLPRT